MRPRLGMATIKRRLGRRGGLPAVVNRPGADTDELMRRRDELALAFSEAQWDLGGLVYEMARRDHFRMDVVVGQAARVQEIDAELGEVQRLLRLDDAAAAGSCSACGALYAHGAVFCWQCGESLVPRAHVEGRIASQ